MKGELTASWNMYTYLYYWLGNVRVKVGHQFTVDVSCTYLVGDHCDKSYGTIAYPQIRMT